MTTQPQEPPAVKDCNDDHENIPLEHWDLTSTISPYLDRHMMFPLLEYLESLIQDGQYGASYTFEDVAAARLSLLRPTHMVDYAIDVYKSIHPDTDAVPAEMQRQKEAVYERLESLRAGCAEFDRVCRDDKERSQLLSDRQWNCQGLKDKKGIDGAEIETYRRLARYHFDCGDYRAACQGLTNYCSLWAKAPAASDANQQDDDDEYAAAVGYQDKQQQQQQQQQQDLGNPAMYYLDTCNEQLLAALWGRLACEILLEDWVAATATVDAVKTALELLAQQEEITAVEALQQRCWLLHWSLFVYWNDANGSGLERLVDLFYQDRYRQAITTVAPHLLRYLTAAVLLCKRRVQKKAAGGAAANVVAAATNSAEARRFMKNLLYILQDSEYSDPIVEFVNCLCVKFDFDSAQQKLAACEAVLQTDFFLCRQTAVFMEEARVFVFENYCRIHNKIDLAAVSEKLAMDEAAAERWLVDLIRAADLPAKIDAADAAVIMGGTAVSIYEQVMDRTRDLNVRSATLAQNLNGLLQEARKERAKRERAAREED